MRRLWVLVAGLAMGWPVGAEAALTEACMVVNRDTNVEELVVAWDAEARCGAMLAEQPEVLYPTLRPPDTVVCVLRRQTETGAWLQVIEGVAFGTVSRVRLCRDTAGWQVTLPAPGILPAI